MKVVVVAVGRLKDGPERELVGRYRERAEAIGRGLGVSGLTFVAVPESQAKRETDRRAEEAGAIRRVAGPQYIAFDERGIAPTSERFAARIRSALENGAPALTYVIGGPDGLHPALRESAEAVFSFGALTLPHQLVRIIVAEQIYRAFTILTGHPYHRVGSDDR